MRDALRELMETMGSEGTARARLAFLSEVSGVLVGSLDYEHTLRRLSEVLVPELADLCLIHVVEGGGLGRLVVASADPDQGPRLRELEERYAAEAPPETVRRVIDGGQGVLYTEVGQELLQGLAGDREQRALLEQLGLRSALAAPLVTWERSLGTLTLAQAGSGRQFVPEDLVFTEEVAHRAALALENARLYRQAQEAIRARDEMTSLLSHDLKNPLTAIRGHAEVLRHRAEASDAPDVRSMINGLVRIEASARRMSLLLGQLVDAARLRAGEPLVLDLGPVDLVKLARQAVAVYEGTSEAHHFRLEAEEPSLEGTWDELRLEQVVSNLVANAMKYSPAGGEISLRVGRREDRALLQVRDHGIGIPAADLPHVFERYRRGGNVAQLEGSGLGLANARQIVEQHGGRIEVTSHEGRGTEVTLFLPT